MPSESAAPECDIVRVNGRYRVGKLLGSGTFGNVYLGQDILRNGREVALKLELADCLWEDRPGLMLYHEQRVYEAISGCPGIPRVHWYGHEEPYEVIVLDRLETSLDELAQQRRLDIGTVFSFAKQMLSILESLHTRHYIHRDIKPENFMTGVGDLANKVFLIDFGLAKRFRSLATHRHIPQTADPGITGTLRYTSINSHLGVAQSRRDDLESLVYTIVFLARGRLPWQGMRMRSSGDSKEALVLQRKKATSAKALCRGLPHPFVDFVRHVRSLSFEEKPNYSHLHSILLLCCDSDDAASISKNSLLSLSPPNIDTPSTYNKYVI